MIALFIILPILKTTQMFINQLMNERTVLYTYNEIKEQSNKKEQNVNMNNKSQKYYAKQKSKKQNTTYIIFV